MAEEEDCCDIATGAAGHFRIITSSSSFPFSFGFFLREMARKSVFIGVERSWREKRKEEGRTAVRALLGGCSGWRERRIGVVMSQLKATVVDGSRTYIP